MQAVLLLVALMADPGRVTIVEPNPPAIADTRAITSEWHGLIVFTADWCQKCKPYEKTLDGLREHQGWDGRFIVRLDYDTHKQYAAGLGVKGLPATVAMNGGRVVLLKTGALTHDAVTALWEQSKGVKTAVAVRVNQKKTTVVIRSVVRGGHSPDKAAIIRHLLNDGIHRGKFSRSWLESLTYAELMSLHSDHHQGRVNWSSVR